MCVCVCVIKPNKQAIRIIIFLLVLSHHFTTQSRYVFIDSKEKKRKIVTKQNIDRESEPAIKTRHTKYSIFLSLSYKIFLSLCYAIILCR